MPGVRQFLAGLPDARQSDRRDIVRVICGSSSRSPIRARGDLSGTFSNGRNPSVDSEVTNAASWCSKSCSCSAIVSASSSVIVSSAIEPDLETVPTPGLGCHRDVAANAGSVHNSLTTEAGALTLTFGAAEGVEDLAALFLCHAGTVVSNSDAHAPLFPVAGGHHDPAPISGRACTALLIRLTSTC